MKAPPVLTVTQLNTYIKSLMDADINLENVFVCGEISNFTNHYKTGHFYMTIKDGLCAVKAVMFKANAQRIKFTPENGMSVIIRGRVSVFERDGQYQIYISDMQPDGIGALGLAFEQLKNRLAQEGLFSDEFKKPIPKYPETIGVITSPTGAAVQDILTILARRFPYAKVVMCPVIVQGEKAAESIISAIEAINKVNGADVLIVGRGGGSIEDLWTFNEERVARAVFASKIPVISAVGHETDFTICDFVADVRAATPSAAAELAVPELYEQKSYIASLHYSCYKALAGKILEDRNKLKIILASNILSNPKNVIDTKRLILDSFIVRLFNAQKEKLQNERLKSVSLFEKLDALSPLKVMLRGYSIAYKNDRVISKADELSIGDSIKLDVSDAVIDCTVDKIMNKTV